MTDVCRVSSSSPGFHFSFASIVLYSNRSYTVRSGRQEVRKLIKLKSLSMLATSVHHISINECEPTHALDAEIGCKKETANVVSRPPNNESSMGHHLLTLLEEVMPYVGCRYYNYHCIYTSHQHKIAISSYIFIAVLSLIHHVIISLNHQNLHLRTV